MYQIDFKKPGKIHFIGIGGISMSGLAEILISRGFEVSGSDQKASEFTDYLEAQGAVIGIGQRAANIHEDMDLVVYTAAIHEDNPEIIRAKELGIELMSRADFMGQIMRNYGDAICISGTHGKTTTTGMISKVLMNMDLNPTISIGGVLPGIGGSGNIRVGGDEHFVVESCEYTNSFLSFFPTMAVILNVCADHLDFFKDLNDIRNSFKKFANRVSSDGLLVINKDIENVEFFTEGLECDVLTYSVDDHSADITAENVKLDDACFGSYDLIYKGENLGTVELKVPGMHNVSNSLAAIGICMRLGIDISDIKAGLMTFTGVHRRFEHKGNVFGIEIIDDYAHHPDEISATLKMAMQIKGKGKLWVAFQSHTYTRTAALFDQFAEVLSAADEVVLAHIYAAREKNTVGVSAEALAEAINKRGGHAVYLETFGEIEDYLLTHAVPGDTIMTVGAGDIYQVGEDLLGR